MTTTVLITLCLFLISSATAGKRPIFVSYQDSLGQYSFGYSDPMSARSEYRTTDGLTRGTYSYIDGNGMIQTTEYEAGDKVGFRVKATNLPEAPLPIPDTPEVNAAREQHLKLLAEREKMDLERNQNKLNDLPVAEAKAAEAESMNAKATEEMITSRAGGLGSSVENSPSKVQPAQVQVRSGGQIHPSISNVRTGPIKVSENLPLHGDTKNVAESMPQVRDSPVQQDAQIMGNFKRIENLPVQQDSQIMGNVKRIENLPVQHETDNAISAQERKESEADINSQTTNVMQSEDRPISRLDLFPNSAQFTPEVMAAREAHFRAYDNAARLAEEADANPQVLQQILRSQLMVHQSQVPNENQLNSVGRINQNQSPQFNDQVLRGQQNRVPIMNENTLQNENRRLSQNMVHQSQVPNENQLNSVGRINQNQSPQFNDQVLRGQQNRVPIMNENTLQNENRRLSQNMVHQSQVPNENQLNSVGRINQNQSPQFNDQVLRGQQNRVPIMNENTLQNENRRLSQNMVHQNSQLHEQLLRGHGIHIPIFNGNKIENFNEPMIRGSQKMIPELPRVPVLIPVVRGQTMKIENPGSMRMDLPIINDQKKDLSAEKLQSDSLQKSNEEQVNAIKPSGLTPASTSVRIADIGLGIPNEFEQSLLKSGGYSTPIETSHLSPNNAFSSIFSSSFANAAFQLTYI